MLQFSRGSISTNYCETEKVASGHNRIGAFTDTASERMVENAVGGWQSRTLYSLSDAEELCDWLDMHGIADQGFQILGNAMFEVRWRSSCC